MTFAWHTPGFNRGSWDRKGRRFNQEVAEGQERPLELVLTVYGLVSGQGKFLKNGPFLWVYLGPVSGTKKGSMNT